MSLFVILLVIISSFMHAVWNLLARNQRSEAVFFNRMLIVIVVIGFVPAVISEGLTHSITQKAWMCLVGSGIFCGLYHYYLARAYGSSDFTIVYPIARSLPIVFLGVGDVLRGRQLATTGWLGMILIIFGCFLIPLNSLREISLKKYVNKANLWIILVAMGTVGYTLLDKIASEVVRQGPATAARYGYIFFFFTYIMYAVLFKGFNGKKQVPDSTGWILPALAAFLSFGAYWLVLWAYQLSTLASYIFAFRQFSIVIGVIMAFIIYKEKGRMLRIPATLLITAGLIIIGLWG